MSNSLTRHLIGKQYTYKFDNTVLSFAEMETSFNEMMSFLTETMK